MTAFDTWAENRQILVSDGPQRCIVDLLVRKGGSWSELSQNLEGGYVKMGHDLNAGAGGYFIALYYKLGLTNDPDLPINEIHTQNTSDGESRNGTRISYRHTHAEYTYDSGGLIQLRI